MVAATLSHTGRNSEVWLLRALALSVMVHGLLLATQWPRLPREPEALRALTVIIAPPSPEVKPEKAYRVAQADSSGGDASPRASNARIAQSPELPPTVSRAQERVTTLEQKVEQMRQTAQVSEAVVAPSSAEPPNPASSALPAPAAQPQPTFNRADLLSQGSKIARLETEIARDAETYQRRPTRKVFGATAMGVNYARYVEDWRLKVEAIGNLNYPQEAREKNLSGTLRLMVALRADGTIERIELERSSGHKVLDEAAERIVRLGAPYAPFPDALRRDTDILEIIRTWTFSRDQRLHAETAQ